MRDAVILERFVREAAADPEVLAVLLYGSRARGDHRPESDTDVCVVLTRKSRSPAELSRKRLAFLCLADLDIQVFQQLPVYIRPRVLKDGKVLFVRDEDALYEAAYRAVQEFEDYRPRYEMYLNEVARVGP